MVVGGTEASERHYVMQRKTRHMPSIEFCNFYALGSDRSFIARADTFLVFEERVGRCQVFIFVWRDFTRVFVGGGEYGYDWIARESDTLDIEALSERFGHSELKQALALRNAAAQA